MSSEIRQQIPEWVTEQFLQRIQLILDEHEEFKMNWYISKPSLIATLNYIRKHGYKCEWIENSVGNYSVKITKNNP